MGQNMMKVVFFAFLILFSSLTYKNSYAVELEKEVAIIGSGPAGLSAAIITALYGKNIALLTGPHVKGRFRHSSNPSNWPSQSDVSGQEIMDSLYTHLEKVMYTKKKNTAFSPHILEETACHIERGYKDKELFLITTSEGSRIVTKTVIIATGTSPKQLDETVENAQNFRDVTLVSHLNKDSPSWHGKRIVIVGSGEDAATKAIKYSKLAESVTLVSKHSEMKVSPKTFEKLEEISNLRIVYNVEPRKLVGDQDRVHSILLHKVDDIAFQISIGCDFVVEALGSRPNSRIIQQIVDCDPNGYIQTVEKSSLTSCPGLFAAGNVADSKYQQAFIASSDGMKAAYDAIAYLTNRKPEKGL